MLLKMLRNYEKKFATSLLKLLQMVWIKKYKFIKTILVLNSNQLIAQSTYCLYSENSTDNSYLHS